MNKIREKLQRFMIGRYGMDQLGQLQWTDTKGIQNHTGSEEKSVDVVVAFGYR